MSQELAQFAIDRDSVRVARVIETPGMRTQGWVKGDKHDA